MILSTHDPSQADDSLQVQTRSRSTSRFSGLLNKALKRRKSENSLLAVKQLGHVVKSEEQGTRRPSSNISPRLLENGTLLLPSTSKPTTPSSDTSDLPSLSSSASSPVPMGIAGRSRSANSAGSSASSAKSEKTGGSDGLVTPADRDGLGLSVLTVEDLQATHAKLSTRAAEQDAEDALVLEVTPEQKRNLDKERDAAGKTSSSSGWKGWLISSSKKQSAKVVAVKPTVLNIDTAPATGLSADPLAGILPSSVSPSSAVAHSEELHLVAKTPASLPAPLKQLRNLSYSKLSALRSPSSHPIIQDQNLPSHLSMSRRNASISAPMRFPRSVNASRRPGEGLGPAESGMRIDVGVRLLLDRIDNARPEDVEAIRTMVLRRRKTIPPVVRRSRDPGICAFLERPPFEDRMEVIRDDGEVRPVESAGTWSIYEIEFSDGIIALAQAEKARMAKNAQQHAHRSGARWNSLDLSQQRKERPPIIIEESESGSARFAPSSNLRSTSSDAVPRAIARRQSTNTFDLPPSAPARNKSSPDLSTLGPRRLSTLRTVNTTWEVSSSSESEGDSEEEDETPLSTLRKTSKTPAEAVRPMSWAPTSGSRPVRPSTQNRHSTISTFSAPAARRPSQRTAAEEDYRALVAKARERRQEARSGETERRAGAEALAVSETRKHSSRPGAAPAGCHSQSAPASPSQRTQEQALRPDLRDSSLRATARPTSHRASTTLASSALQAQMTGPPASLTRRSLSQHDLVHTSAAQHLDPRHSMVFPSINPAMHMLMLGAPMLTPAGMFMAMSYPQVMVPTSRYLPMQPVMMPAAMPAPTDQSHRGASRGRGTSDAQLDSSRHAPAKPRQRSPVR